MDLTKFKLKNKEEILNLISDKENIFVINCKKCYKELNGNYDNDCSDLMNILSENKKNVICCMEIDFLCNKFITEKKMLTEKRLTHNLTITVNSCGIGIQTVSEIISENLNLKCNIVAGSNTEPQGGYHGMALNQERCRACSDCVLTWTGGICPVTNCTKSLLNGPCGGAKNGKCEINPQKDCGWEKIYKKVEELGKIDLLKDFFKIRNYNKPDFKEFNENNILLIEKRTESFYGGIYPDENKEKTRDIPIIEFSYPDVVMIPLSQHTGSICEPLVSKGDYVKTGQKIADSKSYISAPVHSSVTGRVKSIEKIEHPLLNCKIDTVIIETAKEDDFDEEVKSTSNWQKYSPAELIEIIREKGIVGMGGAQFPSHVKLKSAKKIDTLLLNGCECEPYLTGDFRLMIERPEKIIEGAKILIKILNVEKCYICIEDNKKDALESLNNILKKETDRINIETVEVKTKYPQGAEKMLIKNVLKRDVPKGGLPFDVGVVVQNVGTAIAIRDAIIEGIPLIKRVVTVTGEDVDKCGNFEVRIGTLLEDLLKYCGVYEKIKKNSEYLIKMGGPMMGIIQNTFNVPIIKGSTGITLIKKPDIEYSISRSCIKCGRCADVCPMELIPYYFGYFAKKEKFLEAEIYGVLDCIECGCCEYVCPSKISLVQSIKNEKNEVRMKKIK